MRSVDECTARSLLQRFDRNKDGFLSWKELNSECEHDGSDGIEATVSFIELCSSTTIHENHSQSYLQCSGDDTSAVVHRISMDDPAVAKSFCDVLVEQGCSLEVTTSSPLPPLFPLFVATGSLFLLTLLAAWYGWKRRKPGRCRTNDDDDVSSSSNENNGSSEVNDFPQSADHDWSSIESGSSRTDGSSMVPGQMIRRVAKGRIVPDASHDVVSFKKCDDESAEAFALHTVEAAVYDFESIDEDGTTSNNTTMYFDCVPFPSSSTTL